MEDAGPFHARHCANPKRTSSPLPACPLLSTPASRAMSDQNHLAYAVATWLSAQSTSSPQLQEASKIVCDAFGLDLSDSTQKTTYGAGPGLKNVWDVFMKTQAKIGAGAGAQRPAAGAETGGASKSAKVSPRQTLLRNALSVRNSHRLLSCHSH